MPASKYRDIGDVGAVGIEFVLALLVGYYGGHWLDGRFFGGHGYMTAFGCVVGVGAAFKAIFDAAKRANLRLQELDRDEAAARKKAASPDREIAAISRSLDERIQEQERAHDDPDDDDVRRE